MDVDRTPGNPSTISTAVASALGTAGVRFAASLAVVATLVLPLGWPLVGLATSPSWVAALTTELPRLLRTLGNSIMLAFASAMLALAAGVPLAVVGWRMNGMAATCVRQLLAVGVFVPLVLVAGGWDGFFGSSGYWRIRGWTAPGPQGLFWSILIHAAFAVPAVAMIVGWALRSNLCAAEDDANCCGSHAATVLHGSLPAIRTALLFAGLTAAAPALVDITVTDLFKLRTFAEEIFTEFEAFKPASATVGAAALMASISAWIACRIMIRAPALFDRASIAAISRRPRDAHLGGWSWVALLAGGLLAIAPLGIVRQLGLTGDHWRLSTATESLHREIVRDLGMVAINLGFASLAACLAAGVGFLIGVRWATARRVSWTTVWLLLWSLGTPGPLLAVTVLQIWNLDDPTGLLALGYQTPLALICGWTIRLTPWATVIAILGILSFLPSLEAAVAEGAGGFELVCFCIWGCRRWLALAIAVGTAAAFAELPLAHLLSSPGFDALGVRMFQLLHTSSANQPAALAVVIAGAAAGLTWLIQRLARSAIRTAANS